MQFCYLPIIVWFMEYLIAPAALKGSISAKEAADIIGRAFQECVPSAETIICPIADGGTDTLPCLVDGSKGRYFSAKVTGSLSHPVAARWGVLGDGKTAVIESAQAIGLHLLKPEQYDPMHATTYGVGELITKALDAGYRRLIIGMGGSATIDGGAGCMQALGVRLLDEKGQELSRGGIYLGRLKSIDDSKIDSRLYESEVILLSDVVAILCGNEGAAFLFGAQKGATPQQILTLDHALLHFGRILDALYEKPISRMIGSGAAGGLGAGLAAICEVPIRQGIEEVMELLDFDAKLAACEGVITAEGKLDRQTFYGKAIFGIAQRAKKFKKPVHAFVGRIEGDPAILQKQLELASLHQISPPSLELKAAMMDVRHLLHRSVVRYFFYKF